MSKHNPTHKRCGLVLKNQYGIFPSLIYGHINRVCIGKAWCKKGENPPDKDFRNKIGIINQLNNLTKSTTS